MCMLCVFVPSVTLALVASEPSQEVLTEFYKKHDPNKVADAERLLKDHDFKDLLKALKSKYGEVPKPWAKEMSWW